MRRGRRETPAGIRLPICVTIATRIEAKKKEDAVIPDCVKNALACHGGVSPEPNLMESRLASPAPLSEFVDRCQRWRETNLVDHTHSAID
jgi:hypothetical protein